MKNENSMPVNKVKSLEDNLVVCKFDLSNSSSAKLDCILSFQKHLENKCWLVFDKNDSTAKSTLVNKGKIKFFPLCVDDIFPIIDHNGKGVLVGNNSKVAGRILLSNNLLQGMSLSTIIVVEWVTFYRIAGCLGLEYQRKRPLLLGPMWRILSLCWEMLFLYWIS